MNEVCNIAAYQFAALDDLKARRTVLQGLCRDLGLKGTILLSQEGINLFVAGSRKALDGLLTELTEVWAEVTRPDADRR